MRWRWTAAVAVIFASASAALAWDPIGHMIVCQAAYDNLTPSARKKVDEKLDAFNQQEKTAYTFVSAGCWMDDIRGRTSEYNTWHYITLPYTPEGTPFPDPALPNVLYAIHLTLDILSGKAARPGISQAQALVMLLHFVADVHQPLHATDRGDSGGNKVKVTNLKDMVTDVMPERKNLHHFWDSAYRRVLKDDLVVETYPEPPYLVNQAMEGHNAAAALVRKQTSLLEKSYQAEKYPSGGNAEDWAKESHTLGYEYGYQRLPGGDSANPATLDKAYVDTAREISGERLIQAGHRLAALLNAIYP